MTTSTSVSRNGAISRNGALHRPSLIQQWLRRIVIGALVLFVALTAFMWLAGVWVRSNLTRQYPPPGQQIDVGGYRMHLNCTGQGSPTVILEAGLNDFSVQWALVQPKVTRFTRVCTYDRAGLGWSDPSPHPRTSEVMVDELHLLLNRAGINGPYVLVGHSFGGMVMRLFARQHPNEVVGMVLVDSAHEEQLARIPAMYKGYEQLLEQFRVLSAVSSLGLMALSPGQIPNQGLPVDAYAQYQAVLATTEYFKAAIAESEAFYTGLEVASDVENATLGDLPLLVLTRGLEEPLSGMTAAETEQYEQAWQIMQAELAGLSSTSQQIMAEQSGHYIQLQQPDLVIEAIQQVVRSTQDELNQ